MEQEYLGKIKEYYPKSTYYSAKDFIDVLVLTNSFVCSTVQYGMSSIHTVVTV